MKSSTVSFEAEKKAKETGMVLEECKKYQFSRVINFIEFFKD
ncbi:hypothetical protein [Candidatus Arsenophonus triatominarum]|nr:hypothetical protein [Candidatus Arsenophonus triatominarum]